MKFFLSIVLLIHGLIHFMGFAKAFDYGNMEQFSKEISRPMGWLWLLTGLFFMVSAILYVLKKDTWPLIAVVAVVVSQILIVTVWADAKFGTIANVVILVTAVTSLAAIHFESAYKKDVNIAMKTNSRTTEILTEKDLVHLPPLVQNYLKYAGVVGKPKVKNVKIVFEGDMRDRGKDWFEFTSEQHNFYQSPARLFFMKAKVLGLPTHGYHAYLDAHAKMQVKVLSLFPVVRLDSPELFTAETVTFFNDLCLFAPAALIDDRIEWEPVDTRSVKATFTNRDTAISAVLEFNEKGQLVNFISEDRISVDEMKTYPFSTPASKYDTINGHLLPTYGEAVWHYPEGNFVYGKFRLKSVAYNVGIE
ncbi:DUF6544 family protein [Maribacter chungangensis]|uniref:DUF6544 family protein n=1 Tax=Maribacter chungangensis TaxID=1069117 RepID=A0ABW3B492_9FLAO